LSWKFEVPEAIPDDKLVDVLLVHGMRTHRYHVQAAACLSMGPEFGVRC
jgi:hypothetical protein